MVELLINELIITGVVILSLFIVVFMAWRGAEERVEIYKRGVKSLEIERNSLRRELEYKRELDWKLLR